MTEIITETVNEDVVVTSPSGTEANVVKPTKVAATGSQTAEYLIYFFFGALEILLAFRLIFKMMGASSTSAFVRVVYGVTGVFIAPFEGIFRRGINPGLETASIIEPSAIVALGVYAIIAWGVVKMVKIFSGEKQA